MIKPNFLFIGPDKSGSTWLYNILHQHPECYIPPCKDIYFFDRYYNRGTDWYFSLFKNSPPDVKVIGELSHDYLFSQEAPFRIKHDLENPKLITCLRNPVERTFSHYLFLIRSGLTKATFETALQSFPELVDNSLYYDNILRYYSVFGETHFKVFFFDDLRHDSALFASAIFEFLGLSFVDNLPFKSSVLPASKPRIFLLARAMKSGSVLARQLRLENIVGKIKQSFITKLLYKPYGKNDRPIMEKKTKKELMAIFKNDICRLQELLNRDLSNWLDMSR